MATHSWCINSDIPLSQLKDTQMVFNKQTVTESLHIGTFLLPSHTWDNSPEKKVLVSQTFPLKSR